MTMEKKEKKEKKEEMSPLKDEQFQAAVGFLFNKAKGGLNAMFGKKKNAGPAVKPAPAGQEEEQQQQPEEETPVQSVKMNAAKKAKVDPEVQALQDDVQAYLPRRGVYTPEDVANMTEIEFRTELLNLHFAIFSELRRK